MDNPDRYAITAISDARGEGFITASLERQGWQVLYRALAHNELTQFLGTLQEQEVTLFISADFASDISYNLKNHKTTINEIRLSEIPTNDHDFSELIRGSVKEVNRKWSKLPSIPIIAFTSFGRTVGNSTIALNVASEIATQGSRVLLIDAHLRSPFLAPHLRIFGVNRDIIRSPLGFSIFEAHTAEDFAKVEPEVAGYEYLIIDIGEIWQPERAIAGNRIEDYPFTWVAHYATEMITVSSGQFVALQQVRDSIKRLTKLALKARISHLINFSQMYSPKELKIQEIRVENELHCRTAFLPRDDRAAERAKTASSNLVKSAPKSALRAEIARYCRESNWVLS
jgi:Mrp family chromosome partitioning ATPase